MYEYLEYFGLACIPAFLLLDLVYRKRHYATPRYWRLYGAAVTLAVVGVSMGVAWVWGTLLEGYSVLDGRGLGVVFQLVWLMRAGGRIRVHRADLRLDFGIIRRLLRLSIGGYTDPVQ